MTIKNRLCWLPGIRNNPISKLSSLTNTKQLPTQKKAIWIIWYKTMPSTSSITCWMPDWTNCFKLPTLHISTQEPMMEISSLQKPNKPLPASLYAKKMQWKTVSPPWSAKWNVPASLASLKANTNVPVPNICAIWNLTTTNVIHVGTRNILMNMYATSSTTNPYRVLKTNMPSSTR